MDGADSYTDCRQLLKHLIWLIYTTQTLPVAGAHHENNMSVDFFDYHPISISGSIGSTSC